MLFKTLEYGSQQITIIVKGNKSKLLVSLFRPYRLTSLGNIANFKLIEDTTNASVFLISFFPFRCTFIYFFVHDFAFFLSFGNSERLQQPIS